MMKEEGLDAVHRRHAKLAAATQSGARALGFTLFSKSPAHGCTALEPPAGVDASGIVKRLREVYASEAGLLASVENHRLIRVVLDGHEPRPVASLADATRDALRRDLGRQLSATVPDWLWSCLARFFEGPAADFVDATERPADGVKVAVTFHSPPGLQSLRAVLKGRPPSTLQDWPPRSVPGASVRVSAGNDRCST